MICCVRNGFDNVEFLCTLSSGHWRATIFVPKNFHSPLQTFLSSSSNPSEVFDDKKAKWYVSCKAHITETRLLKKVPNKKKNTTKTVPAEPNKNLEVAQ